MANRLARESSPYLLQHANNPVDWHPWGPEALSKAKAESKPIFLSIGYSACHWCHVMEHESFENPAIAAQMNAGFVCVKVDREERPDLDHIYMNAVQAISGRGGWPMSVFLTPDLEPFFGGTYWPPTSGRGMPGFDQILHAVSDAWQNRREQAVEQAGKLTEHLRNMSDLAGQRGELSQDLLLRAASHLSRVADRRHGGFGGAPKFPHSLDLQVLLHVWRRTQEADLLDLATLTLDKMAAGGIYDHLGGGFHRYSVDERWLVPHFEKMLYDNALLALAYTEAFQATKRPNYARVVRETCDFVLRELTDPSGGFYSTQDADSEGEEGKFYVWTPAEIEASLGPAAREFCYVYDVSPEGNFEGHNILNVPKPLDACAKILGRELQELERELSASCAKLLAVRSRRVAPGLDDKVLVSWNGLMIDALARAAGALNEPRYLEAASKAAECVLSQMVDQDGRLLHAWRHGNAKFAAYLDDYGCFVNALVSLYEASFDERWIDHAARLTDVVLARFVDADGGGFFFTADDHERLIARHKDVQDGSVPSGNATMALSLVRLAKLTGHAPYVEAAERTLAAFAGLMSDHPMAAGQMLLALDLHLGPSPEFVFVAEAKSTKLNDLLAKLRSDFRPNRTVACRIQQLAGQHRSPLLDLVFAGKAPGPQGLSLYICENRACQAPLTEESAMAATL